MKLSRQSRFQWNYAVLAFLLPFVGMLCVQLVSSLTYDGAYSLLYSDCYHQYFPFFKAFRTSLLSGESLLYSWNVGMGLDYLGLIAYYLASPLNLLSVLLPESWMLGYFSFLMPLKLGFAGLFFSIFLKNIFGKDDISISIFGGLYALCAWALGYQWNIIWLDTFALLPLVILGMVSLMQNKKFLLYTISLFFAVATNYYIGFFVCIFVLLSFICYQICRWENYKKFFADLFRIAIFTLLALGMTAFLTLPAFSALQSTQSSVNEFPSTFRLNIADEHTFLGLLDAMRQVAGNMNGGLELTIKEGLPNVYCGIIANILAFLFLFSKQIKTRDKVCSILLLLFFNVSFIIRQLDYIWHGFHFPNMIPYRFSFLYSFVMLYMAYRAWLHRRSFQLWQIIAAGVLTLGLVFCSDEMQPFFQLISGNKYMLPWTDKDSILYNLESISVNCSYLAYNLLFLTAYIAAFIYGCRKPIPEHADVEVRKDWWEKVRFKRHVSQVFLLSVMGLELILILVTFGIQFPPTDVSYYPRGKENTALAIDYMKQTESDTLFYRAETTHSQTLNDGALNGYNGISAFTSSANVKVTEFMQALGYGAKNTYNRYCFEEASPVSNLFLNLKYMIERSNAVEDNPYFDPVFNSGNVHLLYNNAYLPLGFLTHAQIVNVDFAAAENPFLLQNELLKSASGITEDCWSIISGNNVTIHGSDLSLYPQSSTSYCYYESEDSKGTVTFRYTADRAGFLCFHVDQTKRNGLSVYLNDEEHPLYSETYSLPQSFSVCEVATGDVVSIEFSCAASEAGTINVTAAILDEDLFRQAYNVLSTSTLELTRFETTRVEGTISCNRDGVLYTSIPQDGNWTATVDGAPAQIVLIGDAMCGLNLSEGEHTVVFSYQNKSFSIGWKVSVGSVILLAALYYFKYKPVLKRKKGKYEQ